MSDLAAAARSALFLRCGKNRPSWIAAVAVAIVYWIAGALPQERKARALLGNEGGSLATIEGVSEFDNAPRVKCFSSLFAQPNNAGALRAVANRPFLAGAKINSGNSGLAKLEIAEILVCNRIKDRISGFRSDIAGNVIGGGLPAILYSYIDTTAESAASYSAAFLKRDISAQLPLGRVFGVDNQLVRAVSQSFSFASRAESRATSRYENEQTYPIKAVMLFLCGVSLGVFGILVAVVIAPRCGDWSGYSGIVLFIAGAFVSYFAGGFVGHIEHPGRWWFPYISSKLTLSRPIATRLTRKNARTASPASSCSICSPWFPQSRAP